MVQKTTNLQLNKPDVDDYYDIAIQNENMDILDDVVGTMSSAVNALNTEVIAAHMSDKENPHTVTALQVGLGNVPNVSTNDQTPTYTEASENTTLTSGEKLSVAFGKIAKAVSSLISHIVDTTHHITNAERTKWDAKLDATATAVNADTVDGLHASSFIQTSQSAKVIVSTTAPSDTTAVWIVPS